MENRELPQVPPDLSDTVQLERFLLQLVEYLREKEAENNSLQARK